MRLPHPPQQKTPPESSQKRCPADEGARLSFIRFLATSTHSRGMARVGNGHSYPLLLGLDDCGGAPPVAPSVGFRYLLGNRAADVVPPYAVILLRLQLGRHLRGD